MSLQSCIDDAREKGSYLGDTLVVFDGFEGRVLLTLDWHASEERWGAQASDESRMFRALAPKGEPEVVAVVAAMNGYLDSLNGVTPQSLYCRSAVRRAAAAARQ